MFEKKDSFKLGTILKPHGIHGEVVLKFDSNINERHFELELILIDIDGGLVPFLFETLQEQTDKTMIAKLKLVENMDEARELNNHSFYVSKHEADKLNLSQNELNKEITGFSVVDKKRGEVGMVNEIIDYENHSVIQAFHGKKEILVPFDPAIVLEIDINLKQIIVDLPEGLLELNE